MSEFSKGYAELNTEQKQAVDAVQGAVLVIAGPGTGKTQLLSLRVANILDKTDTSPENILCLTFTNKAANNMQLRLSRLAGAAGQRVMVKTFHSFAAEVMNLYPQYFWNGAKVTNVPDAVQLEIITGLLGSLPLNNPLALKFAGQFTAVKDVQEALKLAKEAGLTPDKLRALINLNLEYIAEVEPQLVEICSERLSYKKLDELAMQLEALHEQNIDALTRPLTSLSTMLLESFETAHSLDEGTNKTKNTSAWKTRWVQSVEGQKAMYKERERNDWWLRLADVYQAYRDSLHKRGYYDYSDMLIEVITQLEQNPNMRADIQERFQYVLIDEFQDTNAAQLRLAHLVADHEVAEGNPNIMAVGDDDQSIYKFNGAELSNMRGFKRSYPAAQEFVLVSNYRSSQAVLDFSTQLIEQATERLAGNSPAGGSAITKQLVARNAPAQSGVIEHISYPTREHQYYGLAANIAARKQGSSDTVAVLARGHDSLRAMAHALQQQGVAVRYEQQQSIFEQPLIVQISHVSEIVTALAAGDETTANQHIAKLLSHEVWQLPPLELWRLALSNRRQPHWLESMLGSTNEHLQTIARWLLWLAAESHNQPLPRMLELIVGLKASEHLTSPLRHYFLEANSIDTPYLANISAVRKLMGLAQDFCEQGEASLSDFMRLLHVSRDNNRTITDESLFVTAPDAVELLTVHKAKGLEFDSVFVVDAMESIWRPSSQGRKPPANLPLRPSGDTYDDYVRLMFVAVTRAKKDVVISSFYSNENGDTAVPSAIIRDILPARVVAYKEADDPVKVLESAIGWPRLEGGAEKELLSDIVDKYTLSPSAFLDFLDIAKGGPHYFLEKHLLRLPEGQSTAAAFGSAVHASLETAQQLVIDNGFDLARVLNAYETALQKQLLNSAEYERYLQHGQQVITRLFKDYQLQLEPTGKPEVALTPYVNNVPLSGKLDRVDFDPSANRLLISDYKTGKPLSSFQTRSKSLQLKAWRHRTQLLLYALMVGAAGSGKPTIHTQMIYVEAETVKDLIRSYEPIAEELDRTAKLVAIVHQRMTSLNLPDVRHYDPSYDGVKKFEEDLLNGLI